MFSGGAREQRRERGGGEQARREGRGHFVPQMRKDPELGSRGGQHEHQEFVKIHNETPPKAPNRRVGA